MRLVVSLDAEADNQWEHGAPLATGNTEGWRPFQALCARHGVMPTYLVTSEIIADPRAREMLADWSAQGRVEVGAHLHPWTTRPFADAPGMRFNDRQHAYAFELPDHLLREKVATLVGEITDACGCTPTSFRAGRFGVDGRVARCLADAGFLVDSSVTPGIFWSRDIGVSRTAPDFSQYTAAPFRVAGTGDPGLIEIPVTILQTYRFFMRVPGLLPAYHSFPARAARRAIFGRRLQAQPMWLRPFPWYRAEDLSLVWRRAEEAGAEVAVMMFHSSELMPGRSKYRPTPSSVEDLLACLDRFFRDVRASGGQFAGLTEAARVIAARADLGVRSL